MCLYARQTFNSLECCTEIIQLQQLRYLLLQCQLLRLLLRNLVENAHRYSPKTSTITLSLAQGSRPMLIVEDQGPGIDESKVGELSQAFVRMDSRYGGIGLGLSIVTRIAQLHEAAFFLQNRDTETGTRAWVEFKQPGAKAL